MGNAYAPMVTRLMRQGLPGEALQSALSNVAHAPDDPRALSTLAHTLMATGDYAGADAAAGRAVALAENEPAFRFLHARTRFVLGDYTSALAESEAGRSYSASGESSYYLESCSLLAAACLVAVGQSDRALELLAGVGESCVVRAGQPLTKAAVMAEGKARRLRQEHVPRSAG